MRFSLLQAWDIETVRETLKQQHHVAFAITGADADGAFKVRSFVLLCNLSQLCPFLFPLHDLVYCTPKLRKSSCCVIYISAGHCFLLGRIFDCVCGPRKSLVCKKLPTLGFGAVSPPGPAHPQDSRPDPVTASGSAQAGVSPHFCPCEMHLAFETPIVQELHYLDKTVSLQPISH